MIQLAGSINSFGTPKTTFVPPNDPILEIHASELQALFNELSMTYNGLNELLRDQGILRGRELAELNAKANQAVKAEKSPLGKLLLLNAYVRQRVSHIKKALQARASEAPTVIRQAITKIQLRAMAIIEHVKTLAEGKEKISLDSGQARQFLAGKEGEQPSRRDAIRAMRRAEKLCPALECGHRPNDGRQTMRLTGKTENLKDSPIIGYRDFGNGRVGGWVSACKMRFIKEFLIISLVREG